MKLTGISGRECARKLGISEAMVRKDRGHGCPTFPDGSYDLEKVRHWRAMNRGESHNPAGVAPAEVRTEPGTGTQCGAHHDDDCGLEPDPDLTVERGAGFYREDFAAVDIVMLSQVLQEKVPSVARLSPDMAAAVRLAIRQVICTWSEGESCPSCRRAVGIIDPPEPVDDEPEARAA